MHPSATGSHHPLPFDRLSPADFERLCLWLVKREGFDEVEHVGAAGQDQGCDILARRQGVIWGFQCKRWKSLTWAAAKKDVESASSRQEPRQPEVLVFLVASAVSEALRSRIAAHCRSLGIEGKVWARTELDERVRRFPEIVSQFFQLPRSSLSEPADPWALYLQRLRSPPLSAAQQPLLSGETPRYAELRCRVNQQLSTAAVPALAGALRSGPRRPGLLLGEYGQGKTVLCTLAAQELAESEAAVPLVLPLRDLAEEGSLLDLAAALLSRRFGDCFPRHGPLPALRESSASFVLLLDGLDELIAKTDLKNAFYHLGRLTEDVFFRSHASLITCRPNVFAGAGDLRDLTQEFDLYELEFLTLAQVRQYFEARGLAEQGNRILSLRGPLQDIVRRPLFLDMIAASRGELLEEMEPERASQFSSSRLFDRYIANWWRREVRSSGGRLGALTEEEVVQLLAQVAFTMARDRVESIAAAPLRELLAHVATGHHGRGELDALFSQARERLILVPELTEAETVYTFRHQSLQSYFVARHLHKLVLSLDPAAFRQGCDCVDDVALAFFLDRAAADGRARERLSGLLANPAAQEGSRTGYFETVLAVWALRSGDDSRGGWLRQAMAASSAPVAEGARALLLGSLQGMDLGGMDLSGLHLAGANLRRCNLSEADLTDAQLDGSSLDLADLSRAVLRRASLRKASFHEARLEAADLTGAAAAGASFERARMRGATLVGTDLTEASLGRAQLRSANLQGATLAGAVLSAADLRNSDLRHSSFVGARLDGADFSGARTGGSVFSGADVDQAFGLEEIGDE